MRRVASSRPTAGSTSTSTWASRRAATSRCTRRTRFSGISERVEDLSRDQIEYPNEDSWIRQLFEAELAKRGLRSEMPDGAYQDVNYQWSYEAVASG